MRYKLVTMHHLIERTKYLELLKDFKIEKKTTVLAKDRFSTSLSNEYFIEIESINELENLQEVTECAIILYKGTLEIQDEGDCYESM